MRPGAQKKRWTRDTGLGVVKFIPGLDATAQGELMKGEDQTQGPEDQKRLREKSRTGRL